MVSYDDEVEKLGSFSGTGNQLTWWNPTIGSHRVKILEEGQEYSTMYRNQQIPKVRFVIQVDDEKYNWGVNKGRTIASLWGQLATCGKAWNGLVGKEISLIVKMTTRQDGSNIRSYTILEALDIIQAQQTQAQAPQATQANNLTSKMNAIRGQNFNRQNILNVLGIPVEKLESLVSLGLINKQGNVYSVI